MDPTPDDLAGVVDLFGGLTRAELHRALDDLAARQGTDPDGDAVDDLIDDAVAEYYLLAVETDGRELLATGPVALPTLPPHADDLPHMLDVEARDLPDDALARAAEERLRRDAERALEAGDADRATELLDVCYEVDAWGVDTGDVRDRLTALIE